MLLPVSASLLLARAFAAPKGAALESVSADLGELNCWDQVYTPQRCCPAPGRPQGDPLCWAPPYTHRREFCCDESLLATREARLRGQLLARLGLPAAASLQSPGVWDEDIGRRLASELPVSWAANLSKARPAATVAVLLRALRPGAPSAVARRAYAMLLAARGPVLGHLESGWPVFALLELLVLAHRGSRAAPTRGQRADGRSACLACAPSPPAVGRPECVLACIAAARQTLVSCDSGGAGAECEGVTEALRGLLLQRAESELSLLGVRGLWELGRRGAWATLHELQIAEHHRGRCPEGLFLFRTNAEPAYSVCVPLYSWAKQDFTKEHFTDVVLLHGRWRDCDPLHSLAVMSKLVHAQGAWAVDVGFNYGMCTAYLLAMGVSVQALDPSPENAAVLRGAAWEAEDAGRLVVHTALASDHERLNAEAAGPPSVTLDGLLGTESGPCLLKIDVEGDELAVLRGARGLLHAGRVRALTLELHRDLLRDRGIDPWEPLALLIQAGFVVELLPWIFRASDTPGSYVVTSAAGFRAVADDVEARDQSPNIQVIARLPERLWREA